MLLNIKDFFIAIVFSCFVQYASAQNNKFLPDKNGKWIEKPFSSVHIKASDKLVFGTKIKRIADWFHANNAIFANPAGFDMEVNMQEWNSKDIMDTKLDCYYGYLAQINFLFQLFLIENGKETKWTIEPPQWQVSINYTGLGHGSFPLYEGYKVQIDDPKLEKPLNEAIVRLSHYFQVFPLEKEIVPGVRLYQAGNLVVYNPNRPPYWIPVCVREILEARLAFYKIRPGDKILYDYIKEAYDKMPAEELDSPAYDGSEDPIIGVNGKKMGLQIMKFNTEYWDKSLSQTSVQFITMYYKHDSELQTLEYEQNNGHPDYIQKMLNNIDLQALANLIEKK